MGDLQRALDFYEAYRVFGIRPGLDRIEALLEELGNPQLRIPAVHIAGTNGKGSVSAFLTAIAAADDKRVGWYTSPYLENFNERIRVIDGKKGFQEFMDKPRSPEISDSEMFGIVQRLKVAVSALEAKGLEEPTEFELITATAYAYFAERDCDIMILETGMGGRLDATNVIPKPLVSVIAALGYDHQDRLGSHLAQIAAEKAGIIKEDCPLVFLDPRDTADQRGEAGAALDVLTQIARAKGAPYEKISMHQIERCDDTVSMTEQCFFFQGERDPYKIRLLGEYQLLNAGLSIAAARHFATPEAIHEGLYAARWPGRLEFLRQDPAILLDGAHNLQGCQSLRREIDRFFTGKDLLFFTGMLGDKEHHAMLHEVFADPTFTPRAVFVSRPPVPRGYAALDLAHEIHEFIPQATMKPFHLATAAEILSSAGPIIYYDDNYTDVASRLVGISDKTQMPVVGFGSLYLIGNARPLIRKDLHI